MNGHRSRRHLAHVPVAVLALVIALIPAASATALAPTHLWTQRYIGGNPASMAMSPDGSKVFVTGDSESDYGTIAYEAATGQPVWTQLYNGPGNDNDSASSVAVSPDGSKVFVTGTSLGSGTSSDYATIAYDAATGQSLWVRRYDGLGQSDTAKAVAVSPDGFKVIVTGWSYGPDTSAGYATVAYDAATGQSLWTRRYNGPVWMGIDVAFSLAVSPDGSRVFVTGWSDPIGFGLSADYGTIAYDAATGQPQWTQIYNGPDNGFDGAFSVAVAPDGSRVFVTGRSAGSGTSGDYATIAYDAATGQRLWTKRYNGPGNGSDQADSVAVSPDGSKVFVTGSSPGSGSSGDYATIAYDAATGQPLWTKRYNGPGNGSDLALALAVNPDMVLVTGYSTGSGTLQDYATISYDAATGQPQWTRRYNGRGNGSDEASSLAVSPDGSEVIVTGSSDADYVTIAYSTA